MRKESEALGEIGKDATAVHVARFFDSVRTRKPSVQDGSRGHHAAAAAHMVNESIRRNRAVEWDFAADVAKKG
jgi:hypothetical protein